jgi:hypothetical protein
LDGCKAAFVAAVNALDIAISERTGHQVRYVADGGKRLTISGIKAGKIAATA